MKLMIRADASSEIGTGHVMRMIALAQAWQDRGGTPVTATACCPDSLKQRLASEHIGHVQLNDVEMGSLADATETAKLAIELDADWIVLDGYHFDIEYQRAIRSTTGRKLLVVDDCEANKLRCADAILNQNIYADELDYQSEVPGCVNLLGLKYVLLRREFTQSVTAARSERHQVQRVLVTLGGGDPDNVTAKVLKLLETSTNRCLEIRVIIGAANPFFETLRTTATQSRHKIEFLQNVTDMSSQFIWADAVVTAAGSTCWEWLLFGLRGAVVEIADNQSRIAQTLAHREMALNLGWHQDLSGPHVQHCLESLIETPLPPPRAGTRSLAIDTHGARRVCAVMSPQLKITIATSLSGWLLPHLNQWRDELVAQGHAVEIVGELTHPTEGDLLFLLSYWSIVPEHVLQKFSHCLVVHESELPHGRGWSPVSWAVLDGQSVVPGCLLEASANVDAGEIYYRDQMTLEGDELLDEIRELQAQMTFRLCNRFIANYPAVSRCGMPQQGTPTYLPRRGPPDSRLDPQKSIAEQFDLLRIVDNDSYPAFFEWRGQRYQLAISKSEQPQQ